MTQALNGIRILDFTQVLAGPYAVMQLALLGAEVVKIEHPRGDQSRTLITTSQENMAPAFLTCNLNKRSITLDLKSDAALTIITRLLQDADVVVENFKAGTMDALGLGYATLAAIKPDLIYCSISGYGQSGPSAGAAAYDGALQAASGMMSMTGSEASGPTRAGFMPVDMATALQATAAITGALLRKERTGQGQYLDVSMLDTSMVLQALQVANYLNEGTIPALLGNSSPTRQPTADAFRTQDGHLQITVIQQDQTERLFDVLGLSHLLSDDRYATEAARIENFETCQTAMQSVLTTKTTDRWLTAMQAAKVPVAAIRSLADALGDPQLTHRQVLARTAQDDLATRDQKAVVTAGYLADQDGPTVRSQPPQLGEHTDEILSEAGFEHSQIDTWRDDGVI
ncbi:MAG: CoA transferase [Pseudomonadota bacterium]